MAAMFSPTLSVITTATSTLALDGMAPAVAAQSDGQVPELTALQDPETRGVHISLRIDWAAATFINARVLGGFRVRFCAGVRTS